MTSNEIQSDIEQVRLLRALTSKWRLGLTAAFIVITVISTGVMWSSANNLSQDGPPKEQFINELTTSLQQDVLPNAMDIGRQALGQVNIQEEIGKVNAKTPDVANAGLTQLKLLAKDLPEQGQQTLDKEFDSTMKDRQAKLKAEFPQATDEQLSTLMLGITAEAHEQVSLLADDLFTPHIETLNTIVGDLNTIEAKDQTAKSEIPTWQMVFLVSDLARADFTQLQAQTDAETKAAEEAQRKASAMTTKPIKS